VYGVKEVVPDERGLAGSTEAPMMPKDVDERGNEEEGQELGRRTDKAFSGLDVTRKPPSGLLHDISVSILLSSVLRTKPS
jgi:hypothetical protein